VIAHIYKRFGGHPFFIRQLCSQIHKRAREGRPRNVSIKFCEDVEKDYVADIQNYLKEILLNLREFYPEEYSMLEYLVQGDRATFGELVDYSREYVEHLMGYGLLVRREDDYEFAFDAVVTAVTKTVKKLSEVTLKEKWEDINARRNQIEQELQSALFRRANRLDAQEWARLLEHCLSKSRLEQLKGIFPRSAFSRNSSPLYFIELMKFIRTGKEFESEQTSRICDAMNTVNDLRADAHAKKLDDADYKRVSEALLYLEDTFLPPP
jgi:hypothetical protein